MNYQAGVLPGSKGLDPSYVQNCGFLKGCAGTDNKIGIPMDFSSPVQGNYKSPTSEGFKACSLTTQFDVIAERFRRGVETDGNICNQSVSELFPVRY